MCEYFLRCVFAIGEFLHVSNWQCDIFLCCGCDLGKNKVHRGSLARMPNSLSSIHFRDSDNRKKEGRSFESCKLRGFTWFRLMA